MNTDGLLVFIFNNGHLCLKPEGKHHTVAITLNTPLKNETSSH